MVDIGAGTGNFCKVLNHLGIPGDKLLAVDVKYSIHNMFWPIILEANFKVDINDILFIAWVIDDIENILKDYINRGGKYVIIIGKLRSGCTLAADWFLNEESDQPIEGWNVEMYDIPGPISYYQERLTINIKLLDL